jgi:hypothetical protein
MKVDRSKLRKALKKSKEEDDKKKGGFVDERIWKPEIPKKDKNIFRVRVLPFGNEVPWVNLRQHQIKTKTGFWYENCPTTIGKDCPICERAVELYATEDETDAKEASKIYRKQQYFSNILVVKDSRNDGENEGKVFLYKYGKKIFDKFYSALHPNVEEGEEECWFIGCDEEEQGSDFLLVAKTVSGFANYDESKFAQKTTAIAKTDEKINAILDSGYKLTDEISPDKFKSYDELVKLFEQKVLGVEVAKTEEKATTKKKVEKEETDDLDNEFDDDDTSTDVDTSDAGDGDDDLLDGLDDFD